MLMKLVKHEFRATGRVMGLLFLVLLAAAAGANFSIQVLSVSGLTLLRVLGALVMVAYIVAVMGVCFVCFFLMLQRFYRNLLGDEGYVMFTLPVSVHQHVWSKLIVTSVWYLATGAVVMLSFLILGYRAGLVGDIVRGLGQMFRELTAYYALNGTAIVLELLILVFLACVAFALQFYASMAVGYSFSAHKIAWSVVFFFVFQFASQLAGTLLIVLLDEGPLHYFLLGLNIQLSGMAGIHAGIGLMAAVLAVYGALFYAVTVYFLKNRLNLE